MRPCDLRIRLPEKDPEIRRLSCTKTPTFSSLFSEIKFTFGSQHTRSAGQWGAAGAKCERPRPGPDINTTTWHATYKFVVIPPEAERAKKSGDLARVVFYTAIAVFVLLLSYRRIHQSTRFLVDTPSPGVFGGGVWGGGARISIFQNPVFTSPSVSLILFVSVSVCLCVSVCVCLSVMTETFNSDRADDNRLIR